MEAENDTETCKEGGTNASDDRHAAPLPLGYARPGGSDSSDHDGDALLRPISASAAAWALGLCVATLWVTRQPHLSLVALFLLGLGWLAAVVGYLLRFVTRGLSLRHRSPTDTPALPGRWRDVVVPLTAMATAVAVWGGAPMRGAFLASRPFMTGLAARGAALPAGTRMPDRWVGLYKASAIQSIPGGVRFRTGRCGMVDHCGFAFSPNGRPPRIGEDAYRPLGSGWYVWYESW